MSHASEIPSHDSEEGPERRLQPGEGIVTTKWTAKTWPIAAAMIPFPGKLPDGRLAYRMCEGLVGFETSVVLDPAYVVAQSDVIWDLSKL